MTERWVPAFDTDGRYEVSDLGRLRRTGAGQGSKVGRILRPRIRGGYSRAALGLPDGVRHVSVHRLVLESFVGPGNDDQECNHKNGIKTDNRLDNLEWMTRGENIRHAWDTGLQTAKAGEANGRSKLTWDQAREIRASVGKCRDVAARYGISHMVVAGIRRGDLWREPSDLTHPSEAASGRPA